MPKPLDSLLSVHIEQKIFEDSQILENIVFNVEPGRFVVMLGPSGCGKTTLLRIIAGLDVHFDGRIVFQSSILSKPTPKIAMMFQDIRLFPWMTVEQNLRFAATDKLDVKSYIELLNRMDLPESILGYYPRELSGGMAKRVALARAFSGSPLVLLLDEPFSELDPRSKYGLYDLLIATVSSPQMPMATIMVTHDIAEAVYLADEILVLSGSRPATVVSLVAVNLQRPRQRDSREFLDLCTSLMRTALSNLQFPIKNSR